MASESPAAVLVYEAGGIIIGQKPMASSIPVTMAIDQVAIPVLISSINPLNLVTDYLKDGSTTSMKVDGSATPKVYVYNADSTKDIYIFEIRFVFSAQSFDWSGAGFGKAASATLTNGILVELIINSGSTVTLNNIKINEDFLRTFGDNPVVEQAGANDILVSSYRFGGNTAVLKAGTADKVRVTIRDNLTPGSLGVNYLTATFFGNKVI